MRVVNQLLTEMDGLETRQQVFIMAATNRPGMYAASVTPEPLKENNKDVHSSTALENNSYLFLLYCSISI